MRVSLIRNPKVFFFPLVDCEAEEWGRERRKVKKHRKNFIVNYRRIKEASLTIRFII